MLCRLVTVTVVVGRWVVVVVVVKRRVDVVGRRVDVVGLTTGLRVVVVVVVVVTS